MVQSVIVVLPTYNEATNIRAMLDALTNLSAPLEILVVDDNSPDGTADLVKEYQKQTDRLHLLNRNKRDGLAGAYRAGFEWALSRSYEWILQMDGDFSHNPEDVLRLIAASEHSDVVIGSRYVKGGGIDGWSEFRRWVSQLGNHYARFFFGGPVRDLTGGFNLWSRKVLERLDLEFLQVRGYAFQILLKTLAVGNSYRIVEVPICFSERRSGKSKMGINIAMEAAFMVPQLWFRTRGPFSKSTSSKVSDGA